ncbi:unnamed protein product [Triticum turgidum subsp. durum]|uniref:Molybdate-anion transporter n=1 Tax=Triticum turgidum subsp. durum TaxID=4567 RepID=A0A9R0ZGC4_TRITD|nr:unnamed protein product [Triticum turgidum subsp. durum]
MGMVVEREEWVLTPLAYPLISAASLAAVLLLPHFSRPHAAVVTPSSPSPFDVGTTPFLRFRRAFLLLFCLASVAEGIQSVFGEDEFVRCGFGREQMAARLAAATAAALFLGGASGVVSDKLGPQNACIFYWMLQLAVGGLKSFSGLRCAWVNNFILALASSMFCFCFETWIVLEHEKKQDSLFDTFWLMTFFESISLVGSQGITNLLLDDDNKGILLPYTFAALVSIIGILYIRKAPSISTAHHASVIGSYQKSFFAHVLRDKRVLILVLAQASVQFSVSAFWFLWAPTIVADGRDAPLSLIYPCFLVSRMLGSAAVPWFYGAMAPFQNEDSLTTAYIAAGLALSVVAYDYQEIGTLVILFCIFHASMGFILPLLARFRTMYLPNELRGGMMSFSLALGNAPMFIFLIQGAYHGNIANSTILGLAACGLLSAGGCIHMLRRWRKHTRQNVRSL